MRSAWDYASNPAGVEVVVVLDKDDPRLPDYQPTQRCDGPITFGYAPRGTKMSDLWNAAWRAASGDIFMLAADDMVFETDYWDDVVAQAFPEDGIAFVYGDTCTRTDTFGELGFISRQWTDAVGRFTPPYFTHDYCDTWLNDVAKMVGRHRYVPIITRHLRAAYGLAPQDDTSRGIAQRTGSAMPALYAELLGEREAEADKLRAVMQ